MDGIRNSGPSFFWHNNILKYAGRTEFMNESELEEYNKIMKIPNDEAREKRIREMKISYESTESMNQKLIENWNSIISDEDTIFYLGDFCLSNVKREQKILKQLNGYKILSPVGNHDRSPKRMVELGFDSAYEKEIKYKGKILTHYPKTIKGWASINVGVDNWSYYPIPLPSYKKVILYAHTHTSDFIRTCNRKF